MAALALAGCASAPAVVREGGLATVRGRSLAPLVSPQAAADAALAGSVQAGVLKLLAAEGIDVAGREPPAYLLQVGIGHSAPAVGVSDLAGPSLKETAWRSAPSRPGFWRRRGLSQTATAVVIEVASGRPVAWASVRSDATSAAITAQRLARALTARVP